MTALLISGGILLILFGVCVILRWKLAGNTVPEKGHGQKNSGVINITDESDPAKGSDEVPVSEPTDNEPDHPEPGVYGDPLYCTIWPIQDLTVYNEPGLSEKIGTVKGGQTLCVLAEENGSFKVCYDNDLDIGYVDSRFCMINLPEYLKDLCAYNITNSYDSVFRIHEYDIPEVTGTVIPGFENVSPDPASGVFLVPYLYPCAKRLMGAAKKAGEDGYRLKIYESFRPHKATRYLYDSVETLLSEPLPDAEEVEKTMSPEEIDAANAQMVQESLDQAQAFMLSQGIDPTSEQALPIVQFYLDNTPKIETDTYIYRKTYQEEMTNGTYQLSAFLAKQVSAHNRGIALDLTLCSPETGQDLEMQSAIHDLSYHSVSSANNENAKLLESYMTAEGFSGLTSEWWHFQDDITRKEIKLATYLEDGVSLEGFMADEKGFKYRRADGSFVTDGEMEIGEKKYSFDSDGYCMFY